MLPGEGKCWSCVATLNVVINQVSVSGSGTDRPPPAHCAPPPARRNQQGDWLPALHHHQSVWISIPVITGHSSSAVSMCFNVAQHWNSIGWMPRVLCVSSALTLSGCINSIHGHHLRLCPTLHETLTQCCYTVGPTSKTAGQQWNHVGSTSRQCAKYKMTHMKQPTAPAVVGGQFNQSSNPLLGRLDKTPDPILSFLFCPHCNCSLCLLSAAGSPPICEVVGGCGMKYSGCARPGTVCSDSTRRQVCMI